MGTLWATQAPQGAARPKMDPNSHKISKFEQNGDTISFEAKEDSHIILLGGKPLNEPIVGYGSYVMNNEDQIKQVMADYQSGKMGFLKANK